MSVSVAGINPTSETEILICAWSLGAMPTTTSVAVAAKIKRKRGDVTHSGLRLKAGVTAERPLISCHSCKAKRSSRKIKMIQECELPDNDT